MARGGRGELADGLRAENAHHGAEDYFTLGTVVRVLGSQAIRKLTAAGHPFSGLRQRHPSSAEDASQMR